VRGYVAHSLELEVASQRDTFKAPPRRFRRGYNWAWSHEMAKTKQLVLEVLESLPDDCSLEDVQYELYVRQRIAAGEQDADQGKTTPHDQVMREAREWLSRL
jgi:hypothetical protein